MSSTDQAQEPTMEEILASIRRIISDDTEEAAEETETAEASDEIEAADIDFENIDVDEVDVVEEDEDAVEDDVLELTEVVEEEEEVADTVDPDFDFDSLDIGDDEDEEAAEEETESSADIAFVDVAMDAAADEMEEMPDFDVPEPVAAPLPKKGLLSEEADETVAAAFGQLASTLLARDGTTRTLEELVQEMLRPMLKAWLDQNLPTVVEDLVRQEIERVSRRGSR